MKFLCRRDENDIAVDPIAAQVVADVAAAAAVVVPVDVNGVRTKASCTNNINNKKENIAVS